MKTGWQAKSLGEVCTFAKVQGIHRSLPYVGLEDIEAGTGRFVGVAKPESVKSNTFRFSSDHVLYGRLRPYLNKVLLPEFEGHCSTEIFPIKPGPELTRKFLFYWLLSDETVERINATCTGARMPRADMKEVLEFDIPVPPLDEQQRIVGILDKSFEAIATAKANGEKNIQNAQSVFQSGLNSLIQGHAGWSRVRIDDACESIMDCVNKTAPTTGGETAYKMIRTTNVRDGRVSLESVRYVTERVYRDWTRRQVPQKGDVLLTREAPMGEVGILTTDDKVFLGQRIVSYRSNPAKLNNRFLLYSLQSADVQKQIHALASGSTVQHMRVPDSKNLLLWLPELKGQTAIVATLEKLSHETGRLQNLYEQIVAMLDALKRSLLHQAFSAQL